VIGLFERLNTRTLTTRPSELLFILRNWLQNISLLSKLRCIVLLTLRNQVYDRSHDFWSAHQAMQDSHLCHSIELVVITGCDIITTWFQCIIAMSVELCFAPVGQPVQMPVAAHFIHRISESLPHGFVLWDIDQSHPLWLWLRTKRDLANHRIRAAFLYSHYCPFLHTYRKYPNVQQTGFWAATSNDELGVAANKIAPSLVEEEVHKARHIHCFRASPAVPHLTFVLCHVWNAPQVNWKALADMCLSTIRKLDNQPKCRVAI